MHRSPDILWSGAIDANQSSILYGLITYYCCLACSHRLSRKFFFTETSENRCAKSLVRIIFCEYKPLDYTNISTTKSILHFRRTRLRWFPQAFMERHISCVCLVSLFCLVVCVLVFSMRFLRRLYHRQINDRVFLTTQKCQFGYRD